MNTITLITSWMLIQATCASNPDDVYTFYPCEGKTKVWETFAKSSTPQYNLTISNSDLVEFPVILKVKLKFDEYVNITRHFSVYTFFTDSLIYEFEINMKERRNFVFTVQPLYGYKLPNLISILMNSIEICDEGVIKDVWELYYEKPTTTTTTTTTTITTTEAPSANNLGEPCGRRFVNNNAFITSGMKAKPGDWPWHAALYRLKIPENHQEYICGGSLISKSLVITAGHCVMEFGALITAERLSVMLGRHNLIGDNVNLQEKKVYKIIQHPFFQKTNLNNDLALLRLSSEVIYNEYVQPICVRFNHIKMAHTMVGKIGYVVGWGRDEKGSYPNELNEARMPIISKLDCARSHPAFYSSFHFDSNYCAGFGNGTNVCNGDSGSGMYIREKHRSGNIWYLQGIVSLGIPQLNDNICDPRHYTLFTDVAAYTDFIYEQFH